MPDSATGLLLLARPALRGIRERAQAAWPQEGCGLLEGRAHGHIARVRRVIPCRNEHEEPRHCYRIDPEAFLRADHAAACRGRAIVGAWHSHPHGGAYFSDRDREQAWPGWHYLVAAVDAGGMRELRHWYIRTGRPRAGHIVLLP